jgi:hypothetical protein
MSSEPNQEQPLSSEPVLDRFDEDVEESTFQARYDPTGDVLTIVLSKPDSPITFRDEAGGVYVDYDEVGRRLSALTIVNYRKNYLQRDWRGPEASLVQRTKYFALLLLDRIAAGVGLTFMDRLWQRQIGHDRIQGFLKQYGAELRERPERLAGLPAVLGVA